MNTRFLRVLCALLIGLNIYTLTAQSSLSCYHGLRLHVSQDPGWGKDKAVIVSVDPYSPAETAGLQAGAIIESIDGIPTQGMLLEQLLKLLHSSASDHILEVSTLRERKRCLLQSRCRPQGAISEEELAQLFSGYSVEDARTISTTYQHLYSRNILAAPESIRTFAFAEGEYELDDINAATSREVDSLVRSNLRRLGFVEQRDNPDVLVVIDYHLKALQLFREQSSVNKLYSWHQEVETGLIRPLPILPAGVATDDAPYGVSLGVSLVRPDSALSLVWRAEARDHLAAAMRLPEYARYMLPKMFARLPMVSATSASEYRLQTLRYNYTGIIYNPRDISRIMDIDHNSPAAAAGLRIGDKIRSINGHRLGGDSLEELYQAYERFLVETMELRDASYPAWRTGSAERALAPWSREAYPRVAKLLQSSRSKALFAYLFAFRPYVVDVPNMPVVIEIERPGGVYTIELQPELRNMSSTIPIYP